MAREDSLRGLVGAGPSRLGTGGATRVREVSRPTAEDEARAERTVVVRRARPRAGGAGPQAGGTSASRS